MEMPEENFIVKTEHLIIGAGVAGLQLALNLAETGKVLLLTKSSLIDNNSWFAQGGIASVLSQADSFDEHVEDTLRAGGGLCHKDVVQKVVEHGPTAIRKLIEHGARFTEWSDGELHLTKEGGHSKRRVIHAEDITGQELIKVLAHKATKHQNIQLIEHQFAIDLLTTDKHAPVFDSNRCLGAQVLNRLNGSIYAVRANHTYLCTGGHGKVYLYTSNPDGATGDGLAMAWRAGCRIANLEFMQFHPTCLYHPQAKNFLISEALRGEGAILVDQKGEDFVSNYHPAGSLAPRDVVARAIDTQIKKSLSPCVFLDARKLGESKLHSHFPNITQKCLSLGIDPLRDPIPVVPAAHYSCGGIVVDQNGESNIKNLYAIGEVACTGLHGANRLASNSLLEALSYADFVAEAVKTRASELPASAKIPPWDSGDAVASDELVVLAHTWDEIRRLMWNYVGIVRTTKRLERALCRIQTIRNEFRHYYWQHQVTGSILEVRNLADAAYLTIRCAMIRKESRGIHYTIDFPELGKEPAKDTLISGE